MEMTSGMSTVELSIITSATSGKLKIIFCLGERENDDGRRQIQDGGGSCARADAPTNSRWRVLLLRYGIQDGGRHLESHLESRAPASGASVYNSIWRLAKVQCSNSIIYITYIVTQLMAAILVSIAEAQ